LEASLTTPATPASQSEASCSQVGMASWYRGTSKDHLSPQELTAAHRTLPLGSFVRVTAIDTGLSVVVRVNDRGPFGRTRIIDLSKPAADCLGILRTGVAQVRLEPTGAASNSCPYLQVRSG